MIILTGPQVTDEQRGDLAEAAGLWDARLTCSADVMWAEVSALYALEGWESCPLAVADVAIAEAFEIPVKTIPA